MAMDTLQIRIGKELVSKLDELVKTGLYSNRSDVIRDAIRRLMLNNMVGIIEDNEDSIKTIKKTREKLSKKKFNLNELNKIAD